MSQKIPKQISHLHRTSAKLGETTTISRAGALFFLAMAHEVAKSKTFEPLNDVQQLLVAGRKVSVAVPNEESLVLQANFDDLLAVSIPLEQAAVNLDETFEAISRMGQDGEAVVLAQSSWTTNRAPVSDAGVDYIDHSYVAPDTSAAAVAEPAAASSVAPVVVEAEPIAAAVAESDPAFLIFERNLPLDINALPATAAGPLIAVAGLGPLGAVAAGVGALALAGGGEGGGSGSPAAPINNVAVLTSEAGKDGGSVTDTSRTATGKFTVQDADAGQAKMQSQTNQQGVYGTFKLLEDGTWNYTLDPTRAAYKALPKDAQATENFNVKSLDGSAQKTVAVNVIGINDAPAITSMPQTGAAQEDATQTTSGQVMASDVDTGAVLTYSGTSAGTYGSFVVAVDGKWTFTLNNASVQSFRASTTATETFTVFASDVNGAKVMQDVVITIKGSNDLPTVVGPSLLTFNETDAVLVKTGKFTVTDADTQESGFELQTLNGTHGSLSVASSGDWSYTAKSVFDNLSVKDAITDNFNLKTVDGTLQTLGLTIQGTNDNPTVTNPLTLRINENTGTATLDLREGASDIDSGESPLLAVVPGSLTYKIDGGAANTNIPAGMAFTDQKLSIDTTNSLFDLAKGATKSIEVKYNVQDPSGGAIVGQTATIVVTGVNDLPTVSNLTPETREIVETPNVSNSSMPHVLNGTFKVSDTDTPLGQLILKPGVASSSLGSFEFFSINATDGSVAWRYSIADSALDTLSAGNKLTVSKQFSIEDGVDVFSSSVDVLLIGSDTTTL